MFSAATHRLITIPLAKHLDARLFGRFRPHYNTFGDTDHVLSCRLSTCTRDTFPRTSPRCRLSLFQTRRRPQSPSGKHRGRWRQRWGWPYARPPDVPARQQLSFTFRHHFAFSLGRYVDQSLKFVLLWLGLTPTLRPDDELRVMGQQCSV